MDKFQNAVSLALRDTETCIAVAEVLELPMHGRLEDNRRILAVITHNRPKAVNTGDNVVTTTVEQDGNSSEEEGCLFVMKYISPSSTELHPYLLFPIDSKFSASLKQQDGSEGSSVEVTLKAPKASALFGSSDMPALSSVLEEARRLRRIKDPSSTLLSPKLPPNEKTEDPALSGFGPVTDEPNDSDPCSKAKDLSGSDLGSKAKDLSESQSVPKTEDPSGSEPDKFSEGLSGSELNVMATELSRSDPSPKAEDLPESELNAAGKELSGSDPGSKAEELSGFELGLITEDLSGPDLDAKKAEPLRSDGGDLSEPSQDTSGDTSNNLVDEVTEQEWEWLHFYSSYRSSRILPSQRPKPRDIRLVRAGYVLSSSSAGLPGDEDNDIALIRDQWIDQQLSSHGDEHSQRRTLSLRLGTFNVNGKPPTQSLVPWIWGSIGRSESVDRQPQPHAHDGPLESASVDAPSGKISPEDEPIPATADVLDSSSFETSTAASFGFQSSKDTIAQSSPPSSILPDNDEDLPDMFVLGFQELDLSTEALLYSTSTVKADAWTSAIFAALGKSADNYIKLTSKQLVGVLVVVILRKEMQSLVREVSTGAAGVGLMGIMGNKGATAVRLRLNSTTVTFVCSHLAAFDGYFDRRNSDFSEIARKLEFPIMWKGARGTRPLTANIWETDILFWLVNLNYRIDLPDEEVRTLLLREPRGIENRTLLMHDQLRTAARHKRAFAGFIEHDIDFLPTYRFTEEVADQLGYDQKRKPAWTDRILHLSANPTMVSQKSYQSHATVTLSDHQPVSANFDITIHEHDPHSSHRAATAIFETLGDFEDSSEIPTVSILDGTEVNLGSVSYMNPVSRDIRVKNDGKMPCAFRFIPLESGSSICKEWLQVQPVNGLILPGETESIHLIVNIDKRGASFLNHGNTKLEENLILHLVKGTDHIISVVGSYQPTCFANSLAWLVRSPGPIRTHNDVALLPEANTLSSPRELMFLIEWLITNAQDVPDLFMVSAEQSLVREIREYLDTQSLDTVTGAAISLPADKDHRTVALAYGEALLQFLDSLTEPVIPWVLHPRCALARDREDAFEILDDVPSFARNVYVTVTAFLHFIAQSGGPERSAALARVFADVLLRDNPRAPPGIPDLTPLAKRNFLLYTIT